MVTEGRLCIVIPTMETMLARNPPASRRTRKFRFLAAILALAGAILAIWLWGRTAFGWDRTYIVLMGWLEQRGLEAALWLIAFQALQVVSTIPGPFFTVGAGFLFGMWGGSLVAVCGSVAGSVVAYGIARTFPEGNIGPRLNRFPKLRLLERLVMGGGWKVVLATRLVPFFPFKLSNYFFGWVRFPFAPFFWGTAAGIAPITLFSVSAGALASDLAALAHPDLANPGSRWTWSLAALLVAASLLAYAGYRARAALRDAVPGEGGES
jgi:uncharacterized membrane protein YdjX (TVP38/TMEM64 family)